jgi:hypothetical protein
LVSVENVNADFAQRTIRDCSIEEQTARRKGRRLLAAVIDEWKLRGILPATIGERKAGRYLCNASNFI